MPYTISQATFDRMEILYSGIYRDRKVKIAKGYLLPKQKREHGLTKEQLLVEEDAILNVIREYTREAGVRNLDNKLLLCAAKLPKLSFHNSNLRS